jgi:hypothetical protein
MTEDVPASFVGRTAAGGARVYVLTPAGVEQLESRRRHGSARLDWQGPRLHWRGPDASGMELSHLVLVRVARQLPSTTITALFVEDVLLKLPKHGFALESPEVEAWIGLMTQPSDWTSLDAQSESGAPR